MMRNLYILFLVILCFIMVIFSGCSPIIEPFFGGTVTDVDGNVYNTVTIGNQTWMIENLKVTRFRDSTAIDLVMDSAAWKNQSTAAYCWYNNDSSKNKTNFGALYNWYVVKTGKLAPKGWHIPTDVEWYILDQNVSKLSYTSGSLSKCLASKNYWISNYTSSTIGNNPNLNNSSGFAALPGGWRLNERTSFTKMDSLGAWWTTTLLSDTTAYAIKMMCNSSMVDHTPIKKQAGLSIRCIKD
jgi:uncharacterized protein (TIGR02145 family)